MKVSDPIGGPKTYDIYQHPGNSYQLPVVAKGMGLWVLFWLAVVLAAGYTTVEAGMKKCPPDVTKAVVSVPDGQSCPGEVAAPAPRTSAVYYQWGADELSNFQWRRLNGTWSSAAACEYAENRTNRKTADGAAALKKLGVADEKNLLAKIDNGVTICLPAGMTPPSQPTQR